MNRSVTTIRRWMDDELLVAVQDDDGVDRFDPDDIDALKLSIAGGADTPQMMEAATGVVEAGSGLLKGAERHIENLLKLVTDPSQQLIQQMGEENEKLRERCSQLEDKLSELLETMEEVMSRKHERDMDALQVQASIGRKNMGAKMMMSYAPILLGQLMKGKEGGQPDPKSAALVSIIHSLDADKLILLKHTKFVSEEQFEMMKAILTPEQLVALQKIESAMSGEGGGDEDDDDDDDSEAVEAEVVEGRPTVTESPVAKTSKKEAANDNPKK